MKFVIKGFIIIPITIGILVLLFGISILPILIGGYPELAFLEWKR